MTEYSTEAAAGAATRNEAPSAARTAEGSGAAPCSADSVEAVYALDDSCQQLLYIRGHVDKAAMRQAARDYAPHAPISEGAYVLHQYMRHTPLRGNEVSDFTTNFQNEPGRGATPVTVLYLWIPIFPPNDQAQPREALGAASFSPLPESPRD